MRYAPLPPPPSQGELASNGTTLFKSITFGGNGGKWGGFCATHTSLPCVWYSKCFWALEQVPHGNNKWYPLSVGCHQPFHGGGDQWRVALPVNMLAIPSPGRARGWRCRQTFEGVVHFAPPPPFFRCLKLLRQYPVTSAPLCTEPPGISFAMLILGAWSGVGGCFGGGGGSVVVEQQPVSGTASNRPRHPGAPLTKQKHVQTHRGSECAKGERPIGAAKGTQPDTEALCQPPPPPPNPYAPSFPSGPDAATDHMRVPRTHEQRGPGGDTGGESESGGGGGGQETCPSDGDAQSTDIRGTHLRLHLDCDGGGFSPDVSDSCRERFQGGGETRYPPLPIALSA